MTVKWRLIGDSPHFSQALKVTFFMQIWGCHSGVVKNTSLLVCDTLSLGKWFPVFWRIVAPSYSWLFCLAT